MSSSPMLHSQYSMEDGNPELRETKLKFQKLNYLNHKGKQ